MAVWGKGAAAKLLLIKDGWRAFCSRAEVSVFWDLNKCGVDDEADGEWEGETAVDASHIAPNIAKSLRSSGFSGPISIRAYGNTRCLCNNHLMQALLATGVDLHHTSGGTAKHLILDLLLWVRENSPPAHVLLISGDKEFSSVLHKLQMRGYNVLVAHPKADVSRDLLSAASKVWLWDNMMKGTEVSALPPKCNCLQQSPRSCNDTESRYCHNQKVNREFVDVNQDPVCHGLQQKPQNIPKKVVEQVLDVIRSKPRGFTVPAFRRQLVRSSVTLDKNLYGHNDLLSFLLSIPDLKARLVWTSDKTRTFFFTENLDESTNFNEDSKEVLSTSPDDRDIAKQATVKAAHGKRFSGSKMTNISSFQQFNNKVTIDKSSEENIAEVSSDVGLLLDDRATKKTNFFLGGTNIIMSSWNKTLFKLMALKKLWQFVGCKAAKTQQTNSRLCLIKKDEESESKNEIINAESYISSVSSSSPEGEKKSHATYKTEVQGAEGGRQKVIHHSTNYQALDDERKNRNLRLFQKSNKLQSSDCVGTQQTRTGIDLGSEGLPRHSGLHSGVGTTLHEGGINFTDAKSIKDLCDDVFIYLLKKGCTTRSITAEDVLKVLLESNLKAVAELKQEELTQLSQICLEKIMLLVDRETMDGNKPKVSKYDQVSKEKGSIPVSTSTIKIGLCQLTDKEGSVATTTLSQNVEKKSCGESTFENVSLSTIGQKMPDVDVSSGLPKTNVCNVMCEADVRNDLRKMLLGLLQSLDSEVELVSVKPNFKSRYGYALNNKALGYSSLTSLLSTLEEFIVIGRQDKKVVLRSTEHAVKKEEVAEVENSTLGTFFLKNS